MASEVLYVAPALPTMESVGVPPNELGRQFYVHRKRKGWSAERLAARSGLTTGSITRLESGQTKEPGYRVLSRIAVALGFKGADELLGRMYELDDLAEPYSEEVARYDNRAAFRSKRGATARDSEPKPPGGLLPEQEGLVLQVREGIQSAEDRGRGSASRRQHEDTSAGAT